MAWIESHQSLARHRKLLRALNVLRTCDRHKLIGHLQTLWWWGLDSADPQGNIGDITPIEVKEAAEWDGDAEIFFTALLDAGFLERIDTGFRFHNWMDYAGKYALQRARDKQRMRDARSAHVPPTSDARSHVENRIGEESTLLPIQTGGDEKNEKPTNSAWLTELRTIPAWPKSSDADAKLLAHVAEKGYSAALCEYVANSLIAKWPPTKNAKDPVATFRNWLVSQQQWNTEHAAAPPPAVFRPGPSANGSAPRPPAVVAARNEELRRFAEGAKTKAASARKVE